MAVVGREGGVTVLGSGVSPVGTAGDGGCRVAAPAPGWALAIGLLVLLACRLTATRRGGRSLRP